ncbi:MAG: helix-turn-helix transcriptional regulator [Acidobacteria bacterium]|nr:helix-turn-helix transcriptional regulator [Acidobacteriota bacterium]
MSFGARLKTVREKLRLTQEQFAELGGVKRVSQHLYEQNARVPDLNYFLKLREHDVDIGFLILGTTSVPKGERSLTVSLAGAAFRAVDEFARDDDGELLPCRERERFFAFLCATLAQDDEAYSTADLKARLSRFASM